jgi:hypothetical protein
LPYNIGACHVYRDEVEEVWLNTYSGEAFVRKAGAVDYTRFVDENKFRRRVE